MSKPTDGLAHIRAAGRQETIRAARRDVGSAATQAEACANDVREAMHKLLVGNWDAHPSAWQRGDWRAFAVGIADAEESMRRLRNCLDALRADVGRAARLEEEADSDAR